MRKREVMAGILLVGILFSILLASQVCALDSRFGRVTGEMDIAAMQIDIESVTPDPVEPGQLLDVKIRVTNTQTENTLTDMIFIPSWPFRQVSTSEPTLNLQICGGCSRTSTFRFIVDQNASSADYPIIFEANAKLTNVNYRKKTTVKVLGKPELLFFASELDQVVPDTVIAVNLSLKNLGTGLAHNVQLYAQPTAAFAPLGESAKEIKDLSADQTYITHFKFLVDENAKAAVYNIPFQITYVDDFGINHNTSKNVGARIIDAAEIDLQSIKIVPGDQKRVMAGYPFSVIVRVENVGKGAADFTELLINCQFKGPRNTFVGHLERYEDAPAVFELVAAKSGFYQCPITMKYRDDLGWHETRQIMTLQVYSNGYWMYYLLTIMILGAGVYYYHYHYRKNKK